MYALAMCLDQGYGCQQDEAQVCVRERESESMCVCVCVCVCVRERERERERAIERERDGAPFFTFQAPCKGENIRVL